MSPYPAAMRKSRSFSRVTAPADRPSPRFRFRRSSLRVGPRTCRGSAQRSPLTPSFVRLAEPLFAAAKCNRRDAAELLVELGTSPDVESREGERALHIAAYHDSVDVAELLIARGATVDPIGRKYDNTPLGGAMHCRSAKMIALLSRFSGSTWEVAYAGNVDRFRELLAEKPERACATGDGETLLMWLPPHDEQAAMEVARLLLENGADPRVRDPRGMTAADRAERNAMFEVAAFLRERESSA